MGEKPKDTQKGVLYEKQGFLRALSLFFVCTVVFSTIFPASAVVFPGTTVKTGLGMSNDYPKGYWAYMTTTYYSDLEVPVRSSQAEHKAGATTTLGVSAAVTEEAHASASLGCSATAELGVGIAELADASLSGSLSSELEVGVLASYTVGVDVSFTLGEDVEPGLYRIKIVFPRRTVFKRVTGIDRNNVETTLWGERVTYAPKLYDAYWSWESYEIGS